MADTPHVPLSFFNEAEHRRKIALAVNALLDGRSNNATSVTLDANETETTLSDTRIGPDTVPFLVPKSLSAANALSVLWYEASNGEITFHHDSHAGTDRTFGVLLVG